MYKGVLVGASRITSKYNGLPVGASDEGEYLVGEFVESSMVGEYVPDVVGLLVGILVAGAAVSASVVDTVGATKSRHQE